MRKSLHRRIILYVCLLSVAAIPSPSQTAPAKRGVEVISRTSSNSTAPVSYYALVIGNNDYLYTNKLVTAINDANAIAQLLRDRYGFETKVLHDASRDQILSALNEYRRRLPQESNLLIYYAGHGHHDKETNEAYWLPVDAKRDNNSNWISADDITSNIRAIPSQHVIIISDSCYSGALTREGHASITSEETNRWLATIIKLKSRTLMSSGGDEPVADGGGNGHSIFAQAVLDSLRLMDRGQFTAAELFETFVQRKVAGRSDQVPEYVPIAKSGDEGGEFVFTQLSEAKGGSPVVQAVAAPAITNSVPLQRTPAESTATAAPPTDTLENAANLLKAGNYTAAFESYKRLAATGSPPAMCALGLMYLVGQGTAKDDVAAMRLFRMAADAGNPQAMGMVGALYENGMGVIKNDTEAVRWYRKSADGGNAAAMQALGSAYERGVGVQPNLTEALAWYQKAANRGDSQAQAAAQRVQQELSGSSQGAAPIQSAVNNVPQATATQPYAIVHYGGTDASQNCMGWMTLEPGGVRYQAVKGTHGMHNFFIPYNSIKEAKKNGLLLSALQAFHITTNTGENYNFSVFDNVNLHYMSPNDLLTALHAAMGR